MAKVDLNTLKSVDLEKKLGKTIYNSNKRVMDEYIMGNLRNGGSFSVPIVQALVTEGSALGNQLISLYDRKIALEDTSRISDEMKILQASAFDGLVVGINVEKGGEWAIYTANTGVIFGLDTESKFNIGKTVELNENGVVNAVRIDIAYTSEEGFEFKPVSLNKNTQLKVVDLKTGEGKFFLVPYLAIQRSMVFFKEQLDDGRTLEVTQEVEGMNKIRYISARGSELAKYSDSEEFAKSLKPEYFPLKGFFYAPVLGASSMSVGRTRIDVVNVSRVDVVSKPNVAKAENALENMLIDSSIQQILADIYNNDIERYAELVSKLPNIKNVFGDMNDAPSPVMIMKYYHQLKGKDVDKFRKLIPGLGEVLDKKKGVMNTCESYNIAEYSVDEVKDMLKNGVYKFIIRKKDCEYSSMVVTNNESVLRKMYGENYFGAYESLGTRLYKLESLWGKCESEDERLKALKYCGFESNTDVIENVDYIFDNHIPEQSIHERLAEYFSELSGEEKKGKGVRRSNSNTSQILARECFATMNGWGSVDYYRYLDVSKVVSMFRVG